MGPDNEEKIEAFLSCVLGAVMLLGVLTLGAFVVLLWASVFRLIAPR